MFLKKEIIEHLLKCPGCGQEFDQAKILPCGIYCSKCVNTALNNRTEQFFCKFCDDVHMIPENNFKNYLPIERFLVKKPKDTGKYKTKEKSMNLKLKDIEKSVNEIKSVNSNSAEKMKKIYLILILILVLITVNACL